VTPSEPAPAFVPTTGRAALREVTIVYALVTIAVAIVTRLKGVPLIADLVHLAVGGIFLVTAIRLADREEHGLDRHGISLGGLMLREEPLVRALRHALPSALRESLVALGVAAVLFPPFAIAFYAYYAAVDVHIAHDFHFRIAPDLASFALAQVVVVGLPEEAMFRGYVLTRLTDAFPKTTKLFGVEVSLPALVLQAALFALVHYVVDFDPQRLAVFFPGLLFGWVRAWRRGIGASILLHALSNVYADILIRSWLS